MSGVFDRYAEYYDLIYADKDYEKECDFLEQIFRKYSVVPVKSVLDCGCGTGGHAIPLARRGYEVIGLDASETMLGKARQKARYEKVQVDFNAVDLRSMNLLRKFDAAVCMFAVIGYLTSNDDVDKVLRNVRNVLEPGSVFTFDVWNGLAVLRILPEVRVKVSEKDNTRVIRWVNPELDSFNHLCRDHYHLVVTRGQKVVDELRETHTIRFFFPQEIKRYLEDNRFEALEICPFLNLGAVVDERTWNMTCIARAK